VGDQQEKEVAYLVAKMDLVIKSIDELKTSLSNNYVPRPEINELLRSRDERIRDLSDEIMRLRDEKQHTKQLIPAWVQTAIALVAVAISIYAMKG
jgi:uncharacterized coiled-coil DUF342 family protein